jgi:hypothetical protein
VLRRLQWLQRVQRLQWLQGVEALQRAWRAAGVSAAGATEGTGAGEGCVVWACASVAEPTMARPHHAITRFFIILDLVLCEGMFRNCQKY